METYRPYFQPYVESASLKRICDGCGKVIEFDGREMGRINLPIMGPLFFHEEHAMDAVRLKVPDEWKEAAYYLAIWFRDRKIREECSSN